MSNNIRKLRKRKGLSQQELGELIGGDKTTVYKLEKGTRKITEDYMFAIATALDVHPMALFSEGERQSIFVKGHIKMGEEKTALFDDEDNWRVETVPTNFRFPDVPKFIIENRDTGELLECVSDPNHLTALVIGKRYIVEEKVSDNLNRYLLVRVEETPSGEVVAQPTMLNGKTASVISLSEPCCKIVARVIRSVIDE